MAAPRPSSSLATAVRVSRKVRYRRPWLYPRQEAFLFDPARTVVIEASTKVGKTTGCLVWLNEGAVLEGYPGWNGWWVAPIMAQAKIAYDRLKRYTSAYPGFLKFNDSERSAVYPNGAKLWFKGADNPDSLFGDDAHKLVIDEASRTKPTAWHALRTTVTATGGAVRLIGNVKGRKNWFFHLSREAEAGKQDHAYFKLIAHDAVEAGILSAEDVEAARRELPEDVFNELYLAIATEDGANPFGVAHITACLRPSLSGRPSVVYGVDLAKSIDWTVVVGFDDYGQQSAFHRWQSSWEHTTAEVQKITWGVPTYIDSTGVGDPIFERLAAHRDDLHGIKFTSASKQQMMEGLAVALQSRDIGIIAGPGNVQRNELEAFEYVHTRTGTRYEAPDGMHDDTVCALALAVMGRVSSQRSLVLPPQLVTL